MSLFLFLLFQKGFAQDQRISRHDHQDGREPNKLCLSGHGCLIGKHTQCIVYPMGNNTGK